MRLFLLRLFVLAILAVPVGAIAVYKGSDLSSATPATALRSEPGEQVLGVADSLANMIFKVSIPAKFEDVVTFAQPISAPNLIDSLQAGTGIKVDGNQITNTGLLSLVAGTGISVDGNKITNTGITSLSAGTGISIDGNKITNTLEATTPDYTLSGWDTGDGIVYLSDITDKVGIGIAAPTSALHVVGTSNLAGSVTIGTASSDSVTILGSISAGSSIIPSNDLGADLGSSAKRFNNLWVANINSNSSQSFSGQTTFSYAPTDTTISQASILINPTSSVANGQLLGIGIAGYQRALIDEDGDLVVGYNSATSAPATDYPLDIYGHSGTRVSFVDTSGNGYFNGNLGIGIESPDRKIHSVLSDAGTNTTTYGLKVEHATSGVAATNFGTAIEYGLEDAGNTRYVAGDTTVKWTSATSGSPSSAFIINLRQSGIYYLEALKVNNNGYLYLGGDTASYIGRPAANQFNFVTSNYANLLLTSSATTVNSDGQSRTFSVKGASGVDAIYAGTTGLVAIGTSSTLSNAALGVNGNIGFSTDNQGLIFNNNLSKSITGQNSGNEIRASTYDIHTWYTFTGSTYNEKLRLTQSGNLGIGTTSPTSKLHVSGKVTGKALAIFDETGDQALLTASASGVTKFSIANSGALSVTSNLGSSQSLGTFTNTSASRMYLSLTDNAGASYFGTQNNYTFIGSQNSQSTSNLNISSTGNVGIGTTAPGSLLTVGSSGTEFKVNSSGNIALGGGSFYANAQISTNLGSGYFTVYSQTPDTNTGLIDIKGYNDNAIPMVITGGNGQTKDIQRWNSYGGTRLITINPSGNLGIGTTSPTSKLHVSGAVTGKSLAIFDETGDQALLTASASGVTKFVIDHSGQVAIGLGSTAATNTLEVNGSFRAGALSPTNRYASVASTGLMTIRYDDNSVRNPLTLENRDSGAGDEGIGLLFNLARSGSATAINAGLLTVQKEQAWTSTASTQDSYLSFKTTKDGTMAEKLRISSGGLVNGTIGGLATFTKAGTISDTDFADAAVDGLLGFDSTNGRLYVRNAGAWSYIAKTAGFQIPDYESVGLEAGDFLVPYVEKKMEDGAVHGLYTKWSEVKNTLLADLWAKINEIEAKLLTMKDEIFTKKSHQEELCIGTTENETCVTKDQLDKLIELLPSPTSSSSASPTPTPTTSPTPIPSPSLEPSPTSSPSGVQ